MDPSTPPPPPPPPPHHHPHQSQYYETPPPPPPKPNSQHQSRSGTPTQSPGQHLNGSPAHTAPLPPTPSEPYLPSLLYDKSLQDLEHILNSPELLDSLYATSHPASASSDAVLKSSLQSNVLHAKRILSHGQSLDTAREATSVALMQTRGLERAWRDKEKEMYVALGKFSAPALHARLGQAVGEADSVGKALEESFLEEDGLGGTDNIGQREEGATKSGRDVENFVKSYRGVRALYYLRKERKERWDENRVGGWR